MKPEELRIPVAFLTISGIADLKSNQDIMKQKNKHTSLVNKMITFDQQLSSKTCCFNQINHTPHFFNIETLSLLNTTFTIITKYLVTIIMFWD
jgi:hypothetical protein